MASVALHRRISEPVTLDRLRALTEQHAKTCGELVRARRKALGLTLEQTSPIVGVPVQTLSKIERGQIVARDYLRAALAVALVCEVSDLFPPLTRAELVAVA